MTRALFPCFLLLAACGSAEQAPQDKQSENAATAAVEVDDGRIDCRIGNARQFERFCTYERSDSPDGRILTVRKPDGGFRRFLVATDGRGLVAADGAETAQVSIIADNRIEVTIGGDTFRFPATVRGR